MATKTVRPARLNRRRYLEITRLLKEVVGDRKAGLARRMRAAEMLLGVFDRHDKALERKERRVTEATVTGALDTAPTEPVAPKEETVDEFLARIAGMTAAKSAGTTTGVTPLEDDEDDEDDNDEE